MLFMDTIFNDPGSRAPGIRFRSPQAASTEVDSVVLAYHATSNYWYRYLSSMEANETDTFNVLLEDSLQFLHGIIPVQWPDTALLTGVKHGGLLTLNNNLSDTVTATQLVSIDGELHTQGDIVMDGVQTFDLYLTDDEESCMFDLGLTCTATDLELNITHTDAGGCPTSGVLVHTGTIGIECSGDSGTFSHNDSWACTQTFTGNDTHTVVIENSTTRWTYSGVCGDYQGTSPAEQRMSSLLGIER